MRAASRPPGTLNTAKAMNTKNGNSVAITLLSWNCFCTVSDIGPMASATPMTRKARKMGAVLNFIAVSSLGLVVFVSHLPSKATHPL